MTSSPLHRSPSTLHPDDSASQTVPSFFDSGFQIGLNYAGEAVTAPASSVLSSAPSGLLTPTAASNSVEDSESRLFSHSGPGGAYPSIPASFLTKRKSRKGYCWLPSNGTEFFANGKWKWQCARCKLFCSPEFKVLLIDVF
ncbi:hypothetical protein HOY82DRAFT_534942 [Tuber indicum]|nr:hypothetical protein HOY82DRAFT_534942 [Tuber indicum]